MIERTYYQSRSSYVLVLCTIAACTQYGGESRRHDTTLVSRVWDISSSSVNSKGEYTARFLYLGHQ